MDMVEFDEILVPVDGSEGSHRAALFGARLAAALGAPVKLGYVVPLAPEAVMALAKLSREEVREREQASARLVLDQAQALLAAEGIHVSTEQVVMIGDAATEIISYIDKHPRSLIVMGRRGLSPIKSLMVGSVSEKVMRYAQGAVTLVN
jgi:nucleotide-binding universal stress UspA family protein